LYGGINSQVDRWLQIQEDLSRKYGVEDPRSVLDFGQALQQQKSDYNPEGRRFLTDYDPTRKQARKGLERGLVLGGIGAIAGVGIGQLLAGGGGAAAGGGTTAGALAEPSLIVPTHAQILAGVTPPSLGTSSVGGALAGAAPGVLEEIVVTAPAAGGGFGGAAAGTGAAAGVGSILAGEPPGGIEEVVSRTDPYEPPSLPPPTIPDLDPSVVDVPEPSIDFPAEGSGPRLNPRALANLLDSGGSGGGALPSAGLQLGGPPTRIPPPYSVDPRAITNQILAAAVRQQQGRRRIGELLSGGPYG